AFMQMSDFGIEHRRVPRLDKVDCASTGRARCCNCHKNVPKDSWRIGLVFYEEYRFQPSGLIHAGCAQEYFETTELMDRVVHFNRMLTPEELEEVERPLEAPAAGTGQAT